MPFFTYTLIIFALLILICFADDAITDGSSTQVSGDGTDDANGGVNDGANDGTTDETDSDTNNSSTNTTEPQREPTSENSTDSTSGEAKPDDSSPLTFLYISALKPALKGSLSTPVFKERGLVPPFNSCQPTTDDPTRLDESVDCFSDDEFNDRLTYEITYRVPGAVIQSAFEKHPPALTMLGASSESAESVIIEKDVQVEYSKAKITVGYQCKEDSDKEIALHLKLQFSDTDDSIIDIFWKKMCKGGTNSQIEFGYVIQDKDSNEREHHQFGKDSDAPYVVSPGDVSTEVYLKIGIPGAQQAFLPPLVYANNPDVVTVNVRGNHPKGGTLQGLSDTLFQINYECQRKGSSGVFMSVAIPPFSNLSANFEKECGGNIASQLRIGSTEGGFDIVDEGKPTPKYMLGIEHIGTEHSEAHLHLPGNQSDWIIYLSNGEVGSEGAVAQESAVHIGRIGVTVENPDVIHAANPKLSVQRTLGWKEVSNSDNGVYPRDVFRISFHFACRRIGESRLLITVPLRDYDTLEFGIAKECDHVATARKSKEWILTVGNVFWGSILIIVGALAVYCLRRRGKGTTGFARVPVTEQ